MIRKIVLLLFLITITFHINVRADIIKVDSLYLEFEKTAGTNRQYYLPNDSVPKNNFNLGFDISDKLSILYLNTLISSTTDQSQFRYVAMDNEFGLNTTLNLQIYFRHYSGHILDASDPSDMRFPEENVFGIRFHLIGDYR